MSASLVEKHFDPFHVAVELFVDAISQHLALLFQLVLQLANTIVGAHLHGVDLLELMLQLGDSGFKTGCFHWGISFRWLGNLLDLFVKAGFHGSKLCMRDWNALWLGCN